MEVYGRNFKRIQQSQVDEGSRKEKLNNTKTLRPTGLDTDFHNQQVLFPTVTICPLNAYNSEAVNETAATSVLDDIKSESDSFEEFIPVLKSLPRMSYDTFGLLQEAVLNMSDELDIKKYNLRQLAFKVAIKCEDLLEICKYKDEEISCCDYFYPLYSEHGFCYSFNTRYYGTPDEE